MARSTGALRLRLEPSAQVCTLKGTPESSGRCGVALSESLPRRRGPQPAHWARACPAAGAAQRWTAGRFTSCPGPTLAAARAVRDRRDHPVFAQHRGSPPFHGAVATRAPAPVMRASLAQHQRRCDARIPQVQEVTSRPRPRSMPRLAGHDFRHLWLSLAAALELAEWRSTR
jgi:hypothetical protein